MKSLTIIRGIPGSSKSTLAKMIPLSVHVEADQFFINEAGVYQFDQNKLHAAHNWCLDTTKHWLSNECHVVVSNTFTTRRELAPYFKLASEFGIKPNVILCQGDYKSIHNVPEETLKKMKMRFDYNCVDELFKDYYE